jgi:Ras-related protein Rab-7A
VYVRKQFLPQYISTVGLEFQTKEINIEENVIKLQIWDTIGSEKYNSFYRNTECCLLVFDLTEPKSFESIEGWRTTFLNQLNPKDPDTFPFVLLGNKCDKQAERKVTLEKIKQYCENKSNITYFETSAKDNTNVEAAFEEVAKLAFKRLLKEEDEMVIFNGVELKGTNQQTQTEGWCW